MVRILGSNAGRLPDVVIICLKFCKYELYMSILYNYDKSLKYITNLLWRRHTRLGKLNLWSGDSLS